MKEQIEVYSVVPDDVARILGSVNIKDIEYFFDTKSKEKWYTKLHLKAFAYEANLSS